MASADFKKGPGGQRRYRARRHRPNVRPGDLQPRVVRARWRGPVPRAGDGISDWYKNVLKTPTILLAAEGAQFSAAATPTSDAAKVQQVVDKFRAKYGARDVEAYYPKQDVAVEVSLA
jgi:hypothetical protein